MNDDGLHSKFSPSKMERMLACPGSVALEATCAKKETAFTIEGDAAHRLAQLALTDGKFDTRLYLNRKIESPEFLVTAEMCEKVQIYVDAVRDRVEKFRGREDVKNVILRIEEKIDTSGVLGVPEQFGTADTLMIVEFKDGTAMISVEDLKYGTGVKVEAQNNAQLMTYGAGALSACAATHNVQQVHLVIHMPRLSHVSEQMLTADALRAFAAQVKNGVADSIQQEDILKTKGPDALTLNASRKQCLFCRAKSICPAFKKAQKQSKLSHETKKKADNSPTAKF